jgi:hypothetical protein
MDEPRKETLPFPEENGMCGKFAAAILNKKGYNIPVPTVSACLFPLFATFVQIGINRLQNGTTVLLLEDAKLPAGKQKLALKKNDGVVLMEKKADKKTNHFIPFIVENGVLNFYNAFNGYSDVYRVDPTADASDIDMSFEKFFPTYVVVAILFIVPPSGGRRTRRRKRRTRKVKRRTKQ